MRIKTREELEARRKEFAASLKTQKKQISKEQREAEKRHQFDLKRKKRKERHKGH